MSLSGASVTSRMVVFRVRGALERFFCVLLVVCALSLSCQATKHGEPRPQQKKYIEEVEGAGGLRVHESLQEEQGRRHETGWGSTEVALAGRGRELSSFSSVEESTVLFLHVFKDWRIDKLIGLRERNLSEVMFRCAGTSVKEILFKWAKREHWSGAVVEACNDVGQTNEHRICLNKDNDLINKRLEKGVVLGEKLLAGHFLWDFQRYVEKPFLMITTIRNPLEVFVSAQQFMHRETPMTLASVTHLVASSMRTRLSWLDPTDIGFIRRFLDAETARKVRPGQVHSAEEYDAIATAATKHLSRCWVVGIVEQFEGLVEFLKLSLDPEQEHLGFWTGAQQVRSNESPIPAGLVLDKLSPELMRDFNSTSLQLQWKVYEAAVDLWDTRCREVLPANAHERFCSIPPTGQNNAKQG